MVIKWSCNFRCLIYIFNRTYNNSSHLLGWSPRFSQLGLGPLPPISPEPRGSQAYKITDFNSKVLFWITSVAASTMVSFFSPHSRRFYRLFRFLLLSESLRKRLSFVNIFLYYDLEKIFDLDDSATDDLICILSLTRFKIELRTTSMLK